MKETKIIKVRGILHDEIAKSNSITEFDVLDDPTTPITRLVVEWHKTEDGSERPHKILDLPGVPLHEAEGNYFFQDPILKSWITEALR